MSRQAGRRPLGTVPVLRPPDDIVHALAERFAQRIRQRPRGPPGLDADCKWHELLDLLLDCLHRVLPPANRRCGNCVVGARLDRNSSRRPPAQQHRFANTVADAMAEAKVPRDELSTMIYVCWEASQALLETAFRSDPDGDPAIIEQTKGHGSARLAPAFAQDGRATT